MMKMMTRIKTLKELSGCAIFGLRLIASCLNGEVANLRYLVNSGKKTRSESETIRKYAEDNIRFSHSKFFDVICDAWDYDPGKLRKKIIKYNKNLINGKTKGKT